jgi:ABC-type methionine transport system permease subunit
MVYFGSAVLLTTVSSFLLVLVDSPKIIAHSLFSCMTTSSVPILMTIPFVVLLEAVAICPLPD